MHESVLGRGPRWRDVSLVLTFALAGLVLAVAILSALGDAIDLRRVGSAAVLTAVLLMGLGVTLGVWVQRLRALAVTDPLTGLFNRRFFRQRLLVETTRRARPGAGGAVLFIDLDGLKQINDRLGHQAGDQALIAVASSVRLCVRTTDVVARVGGDEFNVILARTSLEHAHTIASRIEAELARCRGPWRAPLSVSIGVAPVRSGERVTPEQVLREADLALYRAKQERGRAGAMPAGT